MQIALRREGVEVGPNTSLASYMMTYEFDVVLKDLTRVTDDQADALFAAGCDDGTPACCNGMAWIHFDREASSLEDAIRLAIAQVRTAGFTVAKIELGAASAVFQGA
jgi:hypothetical protein